MKIIYEVEQALNGWIVRREDEDKTIVVGKEDGVTEDTEIESFSCFLRDLIENYGPSASKFNKKVIRVVVLPGRSYVGDINLEYRHDLAELHEELEHILVGE